MPQIQFGTKAQIAVGKKQGTRLGPGKVQHPLGAECLLAAMPGERTCDLSAVYKGV
jgi:hypothetical protein